MTTQLETYSNSAQVKNDIDYFKEKTVATDFG